MKLGIVLTVAACLFTSAAAYGQAKKDDKKKAAETLVVEVTADELAKDFKDDPKGATKKYNPKPSKPGELSGTLIKLTDGKVKHVKGKDVHVTTQVGIEIVMHAKKVIGTAGGSKIASTDMGSFKDFQRKTIHIDCDEVKLQQVFEEKKK